MAQINCPVCHGPAMSGLRKTFISVLFPATCKSCGARLTFHHGWYFIWSIFATILVLPGGFAPAVIFSPFSSFIAFIAATIFGFGIALYLSFWVLINFVPLVAKQ